MSRSFLLRSGEAFCLREWARVLVVMEAPAVNRVPGLQ
jgi:hypothetical protein